MSTASRKNITLRNATKHTGRPFARVRQFNPAKLAELIELHELSLQGVSKFIKYWYNVTLATSKIADHCSGTVSPHIDHLALYAELFGVPVDIFFDYRNVK